MTSRLDAGATPAMRGRGVAESPSAIQSEWLLAYDAETMFEVHTGTKPGRPAVLALLSAGALVGTLGLAWTQVRGSLALGDEIQIDGTPLIVRSPRGWTQDGRNPRVFGKLVRKRVWRREVWAAERTLEFYYNDFLFQYTQMFQAAPMQATQPGRVGPWDGMQYQWRERSRTGEVHKLYRVVSTPEHAQIGVEYTPLGEVSHGDLQLMDVVCDAVRLDESGRGIAPEELLGYVGVDFPLAAGCEVVGPDNLDGPTVWVQKIEGGRPVWALGVVRRYVREETERLLLITEAKQYMPRLAEERVFKRDDGTEIRVIPNPDALRGGSVFVSLWLVRQSAGESALIYTLADPRRADEALEAAAELAERLRFVSRYPG